VTQLDLIVLAELPAPTPHPVKAEYQRRTGKLLNVFERLKRGPATNHELCQPELGGQNACRSRIPELRKQGWVIRCEVIGPGKTQYTLEGLKGMVPVESSESEGG
jgi:hypothetical protein